ncbi:MAG TPA: response regulator [Terriglobales bacterium]|nr:response regulator [Terriglobales bacterium]
MRILIAEDDFALASFVKKGLDAEHYAVDVSHDGEQARAMAGEFDYDLVVLDLNLPRLDGVAILRYLRTRKPSMPILVLTGRNRVEDRVQCLDLGADDYLGKPFSFSELSARIRALLRRCHLPAESVLTVEDLKLDRVERRVERGGRRIDLTGKEFALLEYLMRNAGRRITRAMIIEHVWNLSFDTCTNVVDVYVNYQLQVNLPGAQVFNGPADTFVAINDLITSMYSNTGIGAAVTELGNALTHVSGQQAFYGNALNQTQSQQTYLNTQSVGLSQQENTVAAADLTSVASQLVNDQTAQTAALEAIGRRPQTSLFDYLK